jgi:hypothetical protein
VTCRRRARRAGPVRGGHQYPHGAVVEDVPHLPGPQHGIHRDEHGTGPRAGEQRHDGLDPLVEEDRDALAAIKPKVAQASGRELRPLVQIGVGDRGRPRGQGGRAGVALGGPRDEVRQPNDHLRGFLSVLPGSRRVPSLCPAPASLRGHGRIDWALDAGVRQLVARLPGRWAVLGSAAKLSQLVAPLATVPVDPPNEM